MKSGPWVSPSQEPVAIDDLSSLMVRAERVLKAALAKTRVANMKGAKTSGAGTIEDVVGEIERMRLELLGKTIVLVPSKDQYVIAAMKAILPKLPTLIEHKREELLQQDIEQFLAFVMPTDPLKDIFLDIENDNVALRDQFVKSNRCLDSKAVAKNAGITSGNLAQTAWRWKSKGQTFAVDYFGKELFPAFQFRDGKPMAVIKKILDVLATDLSSWQIAFWFVAENGWLDGRRPVDLMLRAEHEVVEAAKRAVERTMY